MIKSLRELLDARADLAISKSNPLSL